MTRPQKTRIAKPEEPCDGCGETLVTRYGEPSTIYTEQGAIFSPCETYRYALWRTWDERLPVLAWILLNPSTATEGQSDPTNTRGERRARDMGYGTNLFLNLFAIRTPNPRAMKAAIDPVGPANDVVIRHWLERADKVIAGWGTYGAHLGRNLAVLDMLASVNVEVYALKQTKDGHPAHPLYLLYTLSPFIFQAARAKRER